MEKTYTLIVTPTDVQVIGAALGEVAFKLANPLVLKLNAQLAEQDAAFAKAEAEAAKPADEPAAKTTEAA